MAQPWRLTHTTIGNNMQTFVPTTDLEYNARSLDLRRLGKQIIECRQIGLAITNPDYGWQNHPAVNMWRGHLKGLMIYTEYMNAEWKERRDKDHGAWINMINDHVDVYNEIDVEDLISNRRHMPDWWGDERVHNSHASNLLRKDREHYSSWFYWIEDDSMEYYWPAKAVA